MTRGAPRARPARETALAAVFFLAYTALATWPQAAHLGDGLTDLWDAKLSAWILHWDYVQTLSDPFNLFQAPILHPAKYVLAFSENLYGAAVFGFPLLAAGAPLVVNYNVVLLLGMFLSAYAAWALARYVTGDPLSSLVAGVVYAFLPYRLSQLPHIHMQWGAFLCLTFLFLLRYLDHGRRRDAVLLCVFAAWNGIACIQFAFFTAFLIAVVLVLEAVDGSPERGRRIRGALLSLALAAVICLPFAIPYKKATDLYSMRRGLGEMTFYSARPGYFLSAGDRNKLYGPLTLRWRGPEGDFFPGVLAVALGAAAVAGLRKRNPTSPPPPDLPPARHRAARVLDVLILVTAGLWLWALARPDLQVGPLRMGDPGRVQVFVTIAILARLAIAFPRRSRFRSLADFLRRQGMDRRAFLLVAIAATGILVALGGHTPYYRFLFQTFGSIFRAIRVAARGVVLFQAALAVLAAWGLALLTRGQSPGRRIAWVAAALVVLTLEYRAFPLEMMPAPSTRSATTQWLAGASLEGGVVELPPGFPYDCDYTLEQAEHGKPLVNGHSSFMPASYSDFVGEMRLRPIPDAVWQRLEDLDARLVVYHAHEARGVRVIAYGDTVGRALADGRLELVRSFPHEGGLDFVLAPAGAGGLDRLRQGAAPREETRRLFDGAVETLRRNVGQLAPPFGVIHLPAEGQRVAPGYWAHGWALDDSGIAEVRVGTEQGPAGVALPGGGWPGVAEAYPDYPEAGSRSTFGFAVPPLPDGPHKLVVTLVARDGGVTVMERGITVVNPAPASPKPTGPGS